MWFKLEKNIWINWIKTKVWEHIIDFKNYNLWFPWLIIDNNCPLGYEWEVWKIWYQIYFDSNILWSWMCEIIELKKNNSLKIKLNYFKPLITEVFIEIKLEEKQAVTNLSWKISWNFPFSMFFKQRKIISNVKKDLTKSLEMFKDFFEKGSLDIKLDYIWEINLERKYFINKNGTWTLEETNKQIFDDFKELTKNKQIKALSYFVIYNKADYKHNKFKYKSCVEISEKDYKDFLLDNKFTMDLGALKASKYIKVIKMWDYNFIENTVRASKIYADIWKDKIKKNLLMFYDKTVLDVKVEKTEVFLEIQ